MRVLIYKGEGKAVAILVEATLGNGKPPILLRNVHVDDVVEVVGPVIRAQRGKRLVQPSLPQF